MQENDDRAQTAICPTCDDHTLIAKGQRALPKASTQTLPGLGTLGVETTVRQSITFPAGKLCVGQCLSIQSLGIEPTDMPCHSPEQCLAPLHPALPQAGLA